MKINDISGLYVGRNKEEKFNVLICASDEFEAQAVANSYLADSGLCGSFEIEEFEDIETRFDCDYILTPVEDDEFNGRVLALYAEIRDKVTANTGFAIANEKEDKANPMRITSTKLQVVYDKSKSDWEYETLLTVEPKDWDYVSRLYHALEEMIGINYDPAFTFRLEGSIRFSKPIPKEHYNLSIGGYEMTMAGKTVQFDFEEFRAYIDEDEPDLLHFECKNPDEDCFEDIADINRFMLENVEAILEFPIESVSFDENDEELEEQTVLPVNIESLEFVLPYEDFETLPVSEEVIVKFVAAEWNWKQIIHVTNIDWCIDEGDDNPGLPTELDIEVTDETRFLLEDIDGYAERLANYLSDTFDYCHNGFSVTVERVEV